MRPDFEGHVFKKPMAVIMPGGFVHLPGIASNATRTYSFLVGCLAGSHVAPWPYIEDFQD
jgi:hypothetical protein